MKLLESCMSLTLRELEKENKQNYKKKEKIKTKN